VRDQWYGDKRDLIKWGVLLHLAEDYGAERILQLAFYRPSKFGRIEIDGQKRDLPAEVISHFRDLRTITGISSHPRVTVFDVEFKDRDEYLQSALTFLGAFASERCIVFLDPDTGLEPQKPSFEHVRDEEAKDIWDAMKSGDIFVFYQHQTNRRGQDWVKPKKSQLAAALGGVGEIKKAEAPEIAKDVVFYYIQKS